MTWDRWATLLLAAVAATGTIVSGYVNIARHWRDRNQSDTEEHRRRWSLEVETLSKNGWHLAHLKREVGAIAVRLRSLNVEMPTKTLIAKGTLDLRVGNIGYSGSFVSLPDLSTATRKLVIDTNLQAERAWGHDHQTMLQLDYAMFDFFVSSPPAPSFWRRDKSRRVTITVEAEEISSARRNMRIKVISQPIDWSASAAHKAS
jgi:hypothetical protein